MNQTSYFLNHWDCPIIKSFKNWTCELDSWLAKASYPLSVADEDLGIFPALPEMIMIITCLYIYMAWWSKWNTITKKLHPTRTEFVFSATKDLNFSGKARWAGVTTSLAQATLVISSPLDIPGFLPSLSSQVKIGVTSSPEMVQDSSQQTRNPAPGSCRSRSWLSTRESKRPRLQPTTPAPHTAPRL